MKLIAVALVVASVSACGGGRAEFGREQLSDVRGALRAGELDICAESRHPEGFANDATETRVYDVAIDCDSGDRVRLIVDRFDDVEARDGAAQQFEVLTRPRSDGVVWTWGPFTLFANGARDDDVMDRLTDALDAVGAKWSAPSKRKLAGIGVLGLIAIDMAAVVSVRNLPMMATYGWSMLALFLFSILVFLVPVSMAAAELGTGWPEDGGIYAWVREAFGGRTGFLAVWCDYAENIPWFPTVLSFMAASLAYVFNPALANNKIYLVTVMLAFFWGTTALNLRGVKSSAMVSGIGTVLGSIFPAILVVILGIAWLADGNASQIPFSTGALMPDISFGNLAFLGGIILLFTGMEMAGFHAKETHDPARSVPHAIFLSVAIIVAFSVLGSLFLAIIIPAKELSLVSGTMELFQRALDQLGVGWLLRPLALVVALGGIAHLSPWILGPAKGVGAVARDGGAPRRLGRTNSRDVPVELLVVQGIGGTIFSLLFLLVPSVSTSYWMLSAVTAQIIAVMYALMFAAVIRLRYTQADTVRPYRIPGGIVGIWVVAGAGFAGCVGTLVLGFVPPDQLKTGNPAVYVSLLGAATVALCLPPFLWAAWERRHGRAQPSPAPSPAR